MQFGSFFKTTDFTLYFIASTYERTRSLESMSAVPRRTTGQKLRTSTSLTLDMFDEPEEQDSSLILFYKMNNVNWAAPFKCHLRGITKMCDIYFINHVNCILFLNNCVFYLVVTCFSSEVIIYFQGDAAVGEGVNRHVLSLVMQKLKTGFSINLGL